MEFTVIEAKRNRGVVVVGNNNKINKKSSERGGSNLERTENKEGYNGLLEETSRGLWRRKDETKKAKISNYYIYF